MPPAGVPEACIAAPSPVPPAARIAGLQAAAAPAVSAVGPPPSPMGPVGAREILWRGLDLNLAAATEVRRAAILIGLLGLGAAGPAIAALAALGNRIAELGRLPLSQRFDQLDALEGTRGLVIVVLAIAVTGVVALSIDSQLLAVDVIARKMTRRPFVLRTSLELVRMRFWRLLRANVLIGLILLIPRYAFQQWVAPRGVIRESQDVVLLLVGVVLSIPFAYVAAWILLGQAGARESVRRSWRLARSRPSLAILIAFLNTLFQTIAVFAIGTAADLLLRVVDALGLLDASGLGLAPLAVIVGLGIVATGSLVLTIAALTAGPQVVAFLRLTGDASGLDVLHDPDNPFATVRVEPLVSRPMQIAFVIEAILALLAVSRLL